MRKLYFVGVSNYGHPADFPEIKTGKGYSKEELMEIFKSRKLNIFSTNFMEFSIESGDFVFVAIDEKSE